MSCLKELFINFGAAFKGAYYSFVISSSSFTHVGVHQVNRPFPTHEANDYNNHLFRTEDPLLIHHLYNGLLERSGKLITTTLQLISMTFGLRSLFPA